MYFIGLDVHKKTISFCMKDAAGCVLKEGKIGATRQELYTWLWTLPKPRMFAMEATLFTGWIYDCLRCDFLPECHMASREIRDRRRVLRYRNLVVKQAVQMKNRVSGLLMETGVSYNKAKLHRRGYFHDLMWMHPEVSDSIRPLLNFCRERIDHSHKLDLRLVSSLERDPLLRDRLVRLRTVPGVGQITALTWALEIGDYTRFRSVKEAISYCGLCSDERSSADKVMRMPLSKQRNKHIQRVLVEAAKLAVRQNHELAMIYDKELQRGNPNRAALAVARKLVAYMLAVDRRKQNFVPAEELTPTAAA